MSIIFIYKNKRKTVIISLLSIISMALLLLAGCNNNVIEEYPEIPYGADEPHIAPSAEPDCDENIYINDENSSCNKDNGVTQLRDDKWFFIDEFGRSTVHFFSENLTAHFYENFVPAFNLIPLPYDLPPLYIPFGGSITITYEKRDWYDYQHRLEQVFYDLKIHYSLKDYIDIIVMRVLSHDNVIRTVCTLPQLPPIKYVNGHVFENFLEENVNVEIIEDEHNNNQSYPQWIVLNGNCFALDSFGNFVRNTCIEHYFHIWLIDFSGEYRIIWDMRTVIEAGCGIELFANH